MRGPAYHPKRTRRCSSDSIGSIVRDHATPRRPPVAQDSDWQSAAGSPKRTAERSPVRAPTTREASSLRVCQLLAETIVSFRFSAGGLEYALALYAPHFTRCRTGADRIVFSNEQPRGRR